jgi:hypothetical protein
MIQINKHNYSVVGMAFGVVIALLFAIVISAIPQFLFKEKPWLILLYITQIPSGLLFVLITNKLAQINNESPKNVLLWAIFGALLFDGLALGFFPGIYGHSQEVTALVASLLLWSFGWILFYALVLSKDINK